MDKSVKSIKLGTMFYIGYIGLLLIVGLFTYVGITVSIDVDIYSGNGISRLFTSNPSFFIIVILVYISWIYSFTKMSIQLFKHKYQMQISTEGIHHLSLSMIVLAFIFNVSFKFIPWEHLVLDDTLMKLKLNNDYASLYNLPKRLVLRFKGIPIVFLKDIISNEETLKTYPKLYEQFKNIIQTV